MTLSPEEIELEKVPGGRLDQLVPSFDDRIKIFVKDIVLDEELKKRKYVLVFFTKDADEWRLHDTLQSSPAKARS